MSLNPSLIPTDRAPPYLTEGAPPNADDDFFVLQAQPALLKKKSSGNFHFSDIQMPSRLQFIIDTYHPDHTLIERVRKKRRELLLLEIENMRRIFITKDRGKNFGASETNLLHK